MSMSARVRTLARLASTPPAILTAGWLLFFVYASPGYFSADSAWQLAQGRNGYYIDWHPPAMAALWGVLDRIVEGPFLMLVAQSGALLGGMYKILCTKISPRRAAIIAVAILLFPATLTTMAVIWKDSQMAGYLAAGTACLLSKRRWVRIAGLGLFVLASAMRVNAPAGVLPLVGLLFVWRDGMRWYARYAIAAIALAVVVIGATTINRQLTDEESHTWHSAIAIHDIVGIVAHAEPMSDAELDELFAGTHILVKEDIQKKLRKAYSPRNFWFMVHGETRVFDGYPANDAQRERITHVWKTLLSEHPYAYYRHRKKVSFALLGWRDPTIGNIWDGFDPALGKAVWPLADVEQYHSDWQQWWVDSLRKLDESWVFRPYMYFFLSIAGLVLALFLARDRVVFALLLSGLGNEASLFIGSAAPDFRYSHWMVITSALALALVFARRYQQGRATTAGETRR